MSIFKKERETQINVTFTEAVGTDVNRASAVVVDNSRKEVVNLCKRERKGLSLGAFFLILALILAVVILVEFLGIYRPYKELEAREAQLDDARATLAQLQKGMSDIDEVRAEYRKYNYEHFPRELAEREDILDLMETAVFARGKITRFVLVENKLVLTVKGVNGADVDVLQRDLRENKLVQSVVVTAAEKEDGAVTLGLDIVFKDATEGGN